MNKNQTKKPKTQKTKNSQPKKHGDDDDDEAIRKKQTNGKGTMEGGFAMGPRRTRHIERKKKNSVLGRVCLVCVDGLFLSRSFFH